MKTIQQQTTTNFNAIDFKDALSMVPFMDALVHDINVINYNSLLGDDRKDFKWVSKRLPMKDYEVKQIYTVLTNLGFVSSGVEEILKEDKLIEYFNNSVK